MWFWIIVAIVLSSILYSKKKPSGGNQYVTNPMGNKHFQAHSELMKQATSFKKDGDWRKAIDCLQQAYDIAEKHNIGLTQAALMRLPTYLEKSGDIQGAADEYQKVADGIYCSWYKKEYPISYFNVKGDAWGRLACMLLSINQSEEAFSYAIAGLHASRTGDWLQREDDKKSGINVGRWNPTSELHQQILSFTPGKSKKEREKIKMKVKAWFESIPESNSEELLTELSP